LLCSVGKTEAAVREAQKAQHSTPAEELQLASFLAANQQFAEAATACETIMRDWGASEVDATYIGALSLLADCAQANHDFSLTRSTLRHLIPYAPGDQSLRRRLALATLYDGDGPDAIELLSPLLNQNPADPALSIAYAQATLLCDQLDADARQLLATIAQQLNLEECDSDWIQAVAGAVTKHRIPELQVQLLQELVRRNPASEHFRTQLVDALEASGQHARAKEHLDYLLGRPSKPEGQPVYVRRAKLRL
jgi:thioredoxin-like negative regulator of GroEL